MWQSAFYLLYFIFFILGLYKWHTHFFTAQKHYWLDANTEPMHLQLLQLVAVVQERWIIEEKRRFVKSIRHLKGKDNIVRWRWASYKNLIHIVSQQGIKGLDTTANLTWVNTYISGYVIHNWVGNRVLDGLKFFVRTRNFTPAPTQQEFEKSCPFPPRTRRRLTHIRPALRSLPTRTRPVECRGGSKGATAPGIQVRGASKD